MLRKMLAVVMGLLGLSVLAPAALAADFFAYGRHDDHSIRIWKPYVIEKNCVEDFYHCKVRMDYAPCRARHGGEARQLLVPEAVQGLSLRRLQAPPQAPARSPFLLQARGLVQRPLPDL